MESMMVCVARQQIRKILAALTQAAKIAGVFVPSASLDSLARVLVFRRFRAAGGVIPVESNAIETDRLHPHES